MIFTQIDAEEIAGRFLSARRAASGLTYFPGKFPTSLDEAYAIQDAGIKASGEFVLGWKVGRLRPPLSEQLGAERLAGPILANQIVHSGTGTVSMPVFSKGFAAGEAEFLLRLGKAPPLDKNHWDLDEIADYIDAVHVGIEIASSPLKPIDKLGPLAVISDFGNNNGLLVGAEVPNWATSGFEDWTVSTQIDGTIVGSGKASSFPDGVFGAVRFLFQALAARHIRLEPGQWISSGAVTGVHGVRAGQRVAACFGGTLRIEGTLVAASA